MIDSFLILFFQKWGVRVFKFWLSPKMILQKMSNEYSNYRRIQTIGARHFKYWLKLFLRLISEFTIKLFSNFGIKFSLNFNNDLNGPLKRVFTRHFRIRDNEFKKNFISNVGVKGPLIFDNGPKCYLKMCRILCRLAILPIAEKIDPQERKIDPQNLCFSTGKSLFYANKIRFNSRHFHHFLF